MITNIEKAPEPLATASLTGALLDYWTARAEGVPAEQLTIRQVQRSTDYHVVRTSPRRDPIIGHDEYVVSPSTDWAQGGPLISKHIDGFWRTGANSWHARTLLKPITRPDGCPCYPGDGDTELQAICRAVVRAAFGEHVQNLGAP